MAQLTYAQSGVDREAADRLVERISQLTRRTLNKRVKSSVGGYASLYEIDARRMIAASTDGVGTKLKLAFRLGRHNTVGIDLVAMSVNDLLCAGSRPLFFLDYFATGKLDPTVAASVLEGIVEGCHQAQCALVGGETAEMPSIYSDGEYDLAGFAVGLVDRKRVLPTKGVRPGDLLIGVASSGCHSNGYSLLRKLLPEGPEGDARAEELLTPTRIYVRSVMPLVEKGWLQGLAHITGSGYLNVPRISDRVSYDITLPPRAELPRVYDWVRERSELPIEELSQTFNMGLGLVMAVRPNRASAVMKHLKRAGEKSWEIGEVVKKSKGRGSEVHFRDGEESAVLKYS